MKERAYMLHLLETGQREQAKLLSNTKRYIDDLLCFGTTPPPQTIYKMDYRRTNDTDGDATFLGIRIRNEVNRLTNRHYLRLGVLDKAADYPYQPLAYTTVFSTAPASFGSSIFIGGLVRASRIANNLPDLKSEMNNIFLKLTKRGHPIAILKRAFFKWLLDTYPEPKFQEFCNNLKRHFFYLLAETKKIMEDVGDQGWRVKALKEGRPFIKYKDLLVANSNTPAPTPQNTTLPPTPSSKSTTTTSSSHSPYTSSSSSSSDSILDSRSNNVSSSPTQSDNLRCPGCNATGPSTGPNRGLPFTSRRALLNHQNKCSKYKATQTATSSDTDTDSSRDSDTDSTTALLHLSPPPPPHS